MYLHLWIWCDFDRASPLICGNKMPTRCNRWFLYCRSYWLLNVFRAPLCPSSGAQEYDTVVAACGIWCCGFQVVGLVWSWASCKPDIKSIQGKLLICTYLQQTWQYTKMASVTPELRFTIIYQQPSKIYLMMRTNLS